MFVVFVPRYNTTSKWDLPLSQSASAVGYQGDPWISAHIDDLRPSSGATVIPHAALGLSMSELFMGKRLHDTGSNENTAMSVPQCQVAPLYRRLQDCIQASTSRLEDVTWGRAIRRIEILVGLIPKDLSTCLGKL